MTKTISVAEAKMHMGQIVLELKNGVSFTLTKYNEPIGQLTPVSSETLRGAKKKRRSGQLEHLGQTIPDDILMAPLFTDEELNEMGL